MLAKIGTIYRVVNFGNDSTIFKDSAFGIVSENGNLNIQRTNANDVFVADEASHEVVHYETISWI